MGFLVCAGATCQCTFGNAPATLSILPSNVMVSSMPAATIMDNKPAFNVTPFGMCSSLANPTVSAATSAAMGVLTPQPCTPMCMAAPWAPGAPTVLIGKKIALNNSSKLMCNWGGVISITNPGQQQTQVP